MLETIGAVLAGVTGVVGVGQVVVRFIAGPNQEARELAKKCFELFRHCQHDNIDHAEYRAMDDELGVFRHRVRFLTRRIIERLYVLNEEVWATSPLRPEEVQDKPTRAKYWDNYEKRFGFCEEGQDLANDLIRWTGTLDKWMIGK